jgi:signal transduction histidine kinase
MHAILSFAGLGISRSSGMSGTEKLNHYFQRIKESGERLLELVNDLLDLSKLEAGKMSFNPRPTNLRPLIREAAGEMESLMQDKRLHLHISDEGPTDVFCDPLRFGQLIRNLLSNAIKFSPEGGSIRIGFSTSWLSSGRRTNDRGRLPAVEMTVSDEGIGIPVAERELVFDKFAQSSKTKTGAGGTGLGLAICREIVLAHRGTIVVRANTGPGTCLAVTLPTQDTHIATEDRS